jgi:hypothetical protein
MTTMKKTRSWRGTWGALGLWALLVTAPALAQNRTGTLLIAVRQGGAAASGVKVSAIHTDTGLTTPATARADGSYALVALEPGEYAITATGPDGKEVVRIVTVQVGQTLNLDLDMDVETQGETLVVQGKYFDNATSEVAFNVTREQMDSLPQSSRNFLNFAQLAPGVRPSTDEFKKNVSAGALEASANNVFVDGVSLKNNVIEGGVVGQDASRGNPFPQLAVSGFRVITQNYKAEYEQAGGAIISATTRSGGNDFHVEAFSTLQHHVMVGQDHFSLQRMQEKPELQRYQLGVAGSGPVVKDKLFFFATYEGNLHDRANQVALGNRTQENLDRFGQYEGSFGSPFREHLAFGKLTWRPADQQTVDVSASLRAETDIRSFGGTTSFENAENVKNNVFTASARHQWWLASLTNEATLQFLSSQFNPVAESSSAVGREYLGVIRVGGRDTNQDIGQMALTLRDDVTFPGIELWGQHVAKVGAKVSFQHYRIDKQLFGNPLFRYRTDSANGLSYDFPFEASYGTGNPLVTASNTQIGLYAQDDWEIANRVTVNLGVRWDVETNPLNNDYVTPANVRAAAEQVAAMVEPLNGPDFFRVQNYLTDGTQRPPFLAAIQPRLGVAVDVLGNGSTVVFGGAGRYYDRTLFNTGVDERYRLQYGVRTFRFSADGMPRDGQPTIQWQDSYLSRAGLDGLISQGVAPNPEIFLLENDTKPLQSDQFSAGVRQQVGPVNASLSVTHVRSENGVGFYPANRRSTGNRDWLPAPAGFGNVLISADDRASRYTSVQLVAEKPYSTELSGFGIKWGASLAYTFAMAEERGGLFNFDYPTIVDSPFAPTGNDERHRLVVSGSVELPWEVKLSSLVVLGSGTPYTIFDASQGWGPGQFQLRINGGRAEGLIQFQQVDLRLAKDLTIQGHKVSAFAECFNVFDAVNFAGYDGFIPPAADPPNTSFGKPSSTIGPPRSFQLGLGYAL